MKRFGQIIGVKPDDFEPYKEYHAAIWPEVLQMITACNIRNYSIFHIDGLLFAYFKCTGENFAADMAQMAADQVTQKWWVVMENMQQLLYTRKEGECWDNMDEVFHLG
jgi:L-rhamnose mutarotase